MPHRKIAGDVRMASINAAPALSVAGADAAGWGVQEWMYAATFAYVVLQAAYLVWKWRREAKARG